MNGETGDPIRQDQNSNTLPTTSNSSFRKPVYQQIRVYSKI